VDLDPSSVDLKIGRYATVHLSDRSRLEPNLTGPGSDVASFPILVRRLAVLPCAPAIKTLMPIYLPMGRVHPEFNPAPVCCDEGEREKVPGAGCTDLNPGSPGPGNNVGLEPLTSSHYECAVSGC
jgi:hypothetical protein